MNTINTIISELFKQRWTGDLSHASIELQRKQLHKTLTDQTEGYWSGHTAYHLAVDGGFLIDSRRRNNGDGMMKPKKLTELGKIFMESMKEPK